jgi:hypothetical protein
MQKNAQTIQVENDMLNADWQATGELILNDIRA